MSELAGQTALVTGAAEGIGLGCAQALAAAGAHVILADVQIDKAQAAADAMGEASAVKLDVTSEADWQVALAGLPALHILVNNAGINIPGSVESTDFATWRKVLSVNLDGVFLGCHSAMPLMRRSGGGCITNISSSLGLKPHGQMAPYCASKAGVAMLSRTIALSGAAEDPKVRCNTVYPGSVNTPMGEQLAEASGDYEAAMQQRIAAHPVGFIAEPKDIADMVVYLAKPEARFITGADIAIDGGLSL